MTTTERTTSGWGRRLAAAARWMLTTPPGCGAFDWYGEPVLFCMEAHEPPVDGVPAPLRRGRP